MNRRGFLQGILAAGVAPAFVGSGVLMPLGKIWTPPTPQITYFNNRFFHSGPDIAVFVSGVAQHPDDYSVSDIGIVTFKAPPIAGSDVVIQSEFGNIILRSTSV